MFSPVWDPRMHRNARSPDLKISPPFDVSRTMKCAVAPRNPVRFGSDHTSVIKDIRPKDFYQQPCDQCWGESQPQCLTHLHFLIEFFSLLFPGLDNAFCQVRPSRNISICDVALADVPKEFTKVEVVNHVDGLHNLIGWTRLKTEDG